MIKKKKDKRLPFLFSLFFWIILVNTVTVKAEEEQRITVWYTYAANSGERYYQNIKYETNEACQGGTWYGQYWNGSQWVTYTSGNVFCAGAHVYDMRVNVANIAAAKPSKPEQKSIYFSEGTTYKCSVSSTSNSADFHFRLFANWNSSAV